MGEKNLWEKKIKKNRSRIFNMNKILKFKDHVFYGNFNFFLVPQGLESKCSTPSQFSTEVHALNTILFQQITLSAGGGVAL